VPVVQLVGHDRFLHGIGQATALELLLNFALRVGVEGHGMFLSLRLLREAADRGATACPP